MFSASLKKIDHMPFKTMLALAACLVIICQLIAMALVVEGQVRKAEARDSSLDSRRTAIAQCNQAGTAAARQSCVQQTQAAFSTPQEPASGRVQALAISPQLDSADAVAGKEQGLMPASFTMR